MEEEEKKVETVAAAPGKNDQQASPDATSKAVDDITSHPDTKKKFPMAMVKAKKLAGEDLWNSLSSEEKKERTNAELKNMLT